MKKKENAKYKILDGLIVLKKYYINTVPYCVIKYNGEYLTRRLYNYPCMHIVINNEKIKINKIDH